ncbi:MAG: ComEC/Rec2 family competence protein [Acidobacteriota bacterium]|nr:MAG: ComEC/Rec2 family competence protein [Acidobacteriota bacterium]
MPPDSTAWLEKFRRAPLAFVSAAWVGGILAERAGFSPSLEGAASGAVLLALGAFAAHRAGRKFLSLSAAAVAFVFLSSAWASFSARPSPRSIASLAEEEKLLGVTVTLEGVLEAAPVHAAFGTYLEVAAENLAYYDSGRNVVRVYGPLEGSVRVRVQGPPWRLRRSLPFGRGDRLRLKTTLNFPRTYRNEGGFDYGEFLRRRGVELVANTRVPRVVEKRSGAGPLDRAVGRTRRAVEGALVRHFPGKKTLFDRQGGILLALATGNRAHLDPGDSRRFKETGTFHVLAISGLHMGILGFGVFFLARSLALGHRVAALAAIGALVSFAALADVRASILRAAVMTSVYFAARFFHRRVVPVNVLGAAALILLVWRPRDLFDLGFQLTFGATLSIMLLAFPLAQRLPALPLRLEFLAAVSLAAQAVTMPLILESFHRVSPVGLLLNFWVVPLMGFLMQALAVFLVVAPGSELFALPLEAVLRAVLALMLWPVEWASDAPVASALSFYRLPAPSGWLTAAYYALFAAGALALRFSGAARLSPLRPAWIAGAGPGFVGAGVWAAWAISCLLVVTPPWFPPSRSNAEATMLDVGQGQSVLLELPGRAAMLVDGGGVSGRRFDVGENVVSPFLWRRGVRRLDWLVVTAPRADHVYGAERVLENFRVGELWLPWGAWSERFKTLEAIAEKRGTPVVRARAGRRLEAGGARIEVLYPDAEACGEGKAFLVLSFRCGKRSLLLSSDIRRGDEACLVERREGLSRQSRGLSRQSRGLPLPGGGSLRHDALLVPMHGSASASSARFLDAVAPRLALVSVGPNPWGWPSEKALSRYAGRGVPVLRTDRDGMISIAFREDGWRIATFEGSPAP